MRKFLTVALAVALQAAGLGAPLAHAHLGRHATEHHDGPTVHAHWSGHGHSHRPADTPALDADDHERAVFLNVFVAVAAAALQAPAAPSGVFQVIVPPELPAHRGVDVAHAHDPPLLDSLPARAPPALLS